MNLLSTSIRFWGSLLLPILFGLPPAQAWAAQQPCHFEENKGQVRYTDGREAPEVRFRLERGGTQVFLLEDGIAWQFSHRHYPEGYRELLAKGMGGSAKVSELAALSGAVQLETYRMDMRLLHAAPSPKVSVEGSSSDYLNYYKYGALRVRHYERVTYHEVYPGIDWVIYTTEKGMKYDFVLQPGADPAQIRLAFSGHETLYLDGAGRLVHGNCMGQFIEEAPASYQSGRPVESRFRLEGNVLGFELPKGYDPSLPLVIDPGRVWATYYGAFGYASGALGSTVDAEGAVYLCGITEAPSGIATAEGHQTVYEGGIQDAFLAKFDSDGARQWATYYGGEAFEFVWTCATDGEGNVYLAGESSSLNNIAYNGHQNSIPAFSGSAFLAKFNTDGARQWATYYSGNGSTEGRSCATDADGNVYLSGETFATEGIAENGHQNTHSGSGRDAFLVKFNSEGVRQWATYYGGEGDEQGHYCATGPDGSVYLAGTTSAAQGIAANGHQNARGGNEDAFLVKFNSEGARQWGTYYGGSENDEARACAVDEQGHVYIAGSTLSGTAIAEAGHQDSYGGARDAFLAKFDSDGVRQWGTYYGGSGDDFGSGCAAAQGAVYLSGRTTSATGIAAGGHQNALGGGLDAFLVKFGADGQWQWGTYYGGSATEFGAGCAVGEEHVYLCGRTASASGIAAGGHRNNFGGVLEAFLAKFESGQTSQASAAAKAPAVQAFPNPAHDYLEVVIPDAQGVSRLELYDANGRLMRRLPVQGRGQISLQGLSAGPYFLSVALPDGQQYTQKVMVVR